MTANPSHELHTLLLLLDQADMQLRAIYRQIAEDPDLAGDHHERLGALAERRRDLAQQVGLAALARSRAGVPLVQEQEGLPSSEEEPTTAVIAESAGPKRPDIEDRPSATPVNGDGAGVATTSATTPTWSDVLPHLMHAVGPPRALETSVAIVDEIEALDAVTSSEPQARWAVLPRHVAQRWLAMLVARTRALKELPSSDSALRERVKTVISRYPAWATQHSPGHVNGMQAKHEPLQDTWSRDAIAYWTDLEGFVEAPQASERSGRRVSGGVARRGSAS